jgi:hypothetical protein
MQRLARIITQACKSLLAKRFFTPSLPVILSAVKDLTKLCDGIYHDAVKDLFKLCDVAYQYAVKDLTKLCGGIY